MTDQEKEAKVKSLMEGIDLIKSGYAGVDRNGTIKDRRTTQGLIACRENSLLATPKPKKVEGEYKEGSSDFFKARNA